MPGVFSGRKPLARNPGVGPHPDVVLFEFAVERVQAVLKPGAFDRDPEVLKPDLSNSASDSEAQGNF